NYLNEARPYIKGHIEITIMADAALAENEYKRGRFKKSKNLILKLLPKVQTVSFTEERIKMLILLSNVYIASGDFSQAKDYAESALANSIDPENKILAYSQLSRVYEVNGLMDKALDAKDSIIVFTDSLYQMKNGRFFESNKVKFEIASYRQELQQNQERDKTERKALYSLLYVSLLVILLIVWVFRNTSLKNKQRKIHYNRSKQIIELELQKKESDNLLLEKQLQATESQSLLEEERLKNEIETRNRKLAA